jgi:hypothetical protein
MGFAQRTGNPVTALARWRKRNLKRTQRDFLKRAV